MPLVDSGTYGKSNTDNYLLGRGILRLDIYNSSNAATGAFFDVGNCTSFSLNIDEETLEHQSSREGLKQTDASVTLSKTLGGSFTLDELAMRQMGFFLSSDVYEDSYSVTPPQQTDTDITIPNLDNGPGGHSFEIFWGNDTRAYLIDSAATFTVTSDGGGTTYDITDDYEVDYTNGLLYIVPNGQIDIDLAAGGNLDVTWNPTDNQRIQEVNMLSKDSIRAALLFVSENAGTSKQREVRLHSCKIVANGDLGQISEEFATMEFNFIAEAVTTPPKGFTAATSDSGKDATVGTIRELFASS